MLRRALKGLIRTVVNTFFRRIDVVGREFVPEEGPVIFAGNHPNALMDGFLLISESGRWPVRFVANAKLWQYRLLAPLLDALGAVPVVRREEHDGEVDNSKAFEALFGILEAGECMGIFPEGISHAESQLAKLKTGTARIALGVSARGRVRVRVVPCGLTYLHRHRFRSQVLLEFGEPVAVDESWLERFREDEQAAVQAFTGRLAQALAEVTLNAPDWRTLRFVQTARRLYKPASAQLTPGTYVDLSRRFVERYLDSMDQPDMQRFRESVENYQARLDLLGLKDYQLRNPRDIAKTLRRLTVRSVMLLLLLPLALPGALLHLPVGWIAALVGERFSYEQDDIATLKVFATVLLLPLVYLAVAILVGTNFGAAWGILAGFALPFSFVISVQLLEAEVGLAMSVMSILRLTRLRSDVEDLRRERAALVKQVRELADRYADPDLPRIFTGEDFSGPA